MQGLALAPGQSALQIECGMHHMITDFFSLSWSMSTECTLCAAMHAWVCKLANEWVCRVWAR